MELLICVFAILERATVYRESERERGRCLHCNTATCGEESELEVIASEFHLCIVDRSDSWSLRTPVVFPTSGFPR